MSQLKQRLLRFLLAASPLRAYGETLLLFMLLAALMALVYQSNTANITTTALLFLINPLNALYYALRVRVPRGRWYRRIGLDVLWLTVPALLLNTAFWLIARQVAVDMVASTADLQMIDGLMIALLAFPYVFFRTVTRFVVWWNALRQRRVIWSLVSSNLVAVALLQALVVLPLVLILFFSNFAGSSFMDMLGSPLAQWLYRLQLALPLVGLAILMATAVLIALLPVSIAVSYFFASDMRRRLNVLLDAAHAARDGNYDTQIAVSGEDEIARLQADFNLMTANLKITVGELRDEREKVAELLKHRREMMANVSHELRTPIATVRAYLDSAARQQNQDSDVRITQHDLAIIERETLRLQTLIDDLFALSRAEVDQLALKLAPIDSIAVIRRVIETVAPLAWRVNRIEIVSSLPGWLPNISADEVRLEQVLRNLIHNSLRYTPPGGLVIVSVQELNGCAEIQVQDTGEGIRPEDLPHIWERYYRSAENGGTGLGLALVKSFVEAMHGQVGVTSTQGEGACFTIRLPFANPSATMTSMLPKPQPVVRSTSPTSKTPVSPR